MPPVKGLHPLYPASQPIPTVMYQWSVSPIPTIAAPHPSRSFDKLGMYLRRSRFQEEKDVAGPSSGSGQRTPTPPAGLLRQSQDVAAPLHPAAFLFFQNQ